MSIILREFERFKCACDKQPWFSVVPGLGYGYFYRCYNLNNGLTNEQMILDIVKKTFAKTRKRKDKKI